MSIFGGSGGGQGGGSGQGGGRRQDGSGQGQGLGKGGGRGRNNGSSLGVGGFCVCTKCGTKIAHDQGTPCTQLKCPKCGNTMIREELLRK